MSNDRLYSKMIKDIQESPFSHIIKSYLVELTNIYRIGIMKSIPLKEVPALSPLLGEKVRAKYDFRNFEKMCIECGASGVIICNAKCMQMRETRLKKIGICQRAFIFSDMCKGKVINGLCWLHR